MKLVGRILTFIWTGFWLLIGSVAIFNTSGQIERDKDFVKTQIKPAVDWTNQFKNDSARLPTYLEFFTWEKEFYNDYSTGLTLKADSSISALGLIHYIRRTSDIVSQDLPRFNKANWTKDFSIGVWRGDWMEYYYSWDGSYDTNNYSWGDSFKMLLYCLGMGIIPFIFWYILYWRNKKSSTQRLTSQGTG